MKYLFLIFEFSFNLLTAQTVKDSLQIKVEQSLLKLRLKLNVLKEDNSSHIYSDATFYKITFTKENDTPFALNIIDEFLVNNCFKKSDISKPNSIYLVKEFRNDELLRAFRLQRKPANPTMESIQKYLGITNKVGGYILLIIFLTQ